MNLNYINAITSLVISFTCLHVYGMEPAQQKYALSDFLNPQKEQEYLHTHAVKGELREMLDQHFPSIFNEKGHPDLKKTDRLNYEGLCVTLESPLIPGYVIKSTYENSLDRICGAELMRTCAHDLNLDKAGCPAKEVYTDPRSGKRYIVARKILATNKAFSFEQMVQLYKLIKATNYQDVKPDGQKENILNGLDGIAYIIDTEERSFRKFHPLVGGVGDLERLHLDTQARNFIHAKIYDQSYLYNTGKAVNK